MPKIDYAPRGKEKADTTITIKVSASKKKSLQRLAKKNGQTLSAYLLK